MRFSLTDVHLLFGQKIIFVSIAIFLTIFYAVASNPNLPSYDLPSYDDIMQDVNYLIDHDKQERSKASILQKAKKFFTLSNGYIQITSENAPNIYILIKEAAKTIGIDIPSKIYFNTNAANFDNCNARVAKNRNGETYLSLGSKLLCGLTPAETKAILEHEFMHIKDKMLEQLMPKMTKAKVFLSSLAIAYITLAAFSWKAAYSLEYSDAAIALLAVPSIWLLWTGATKNSEDLCRLSKELEKNADLNVNSKPDLINALKKIIAMALSEKLKNDVSKSIVAVIPLIEDDISSALIKHIENGNLDFYDPLHPSIQERFKYLKEISGDTPAENKINAVESCSQPVTA
jgi:hypothetical protein